MFLYAIFVFALFQAGSSAPQEELDYRLVFEEIDPDIILDNERLLNSYLKCFFNEGTCNIHQQAVKVLRTVCGDCSEKQKGIFKYSMNKFIPNHKEDWDRMLTIYDPTGEYWPNVKVFLAS